MDDLKGMYRQAVAGRIRELEAALSTLDAEGESAAAAIRRVAHSLRGSGGTYGFPEVTAAASAAEDAPAETLVERTHALLAVLRGITAAARPTRILAVDDDPEIQVLLRYVLERAGREVVLAGTAAAARAALAGDPFDLILLDLVLPDEDGRTLLRHIRNLPASEGVPVFVLSGKSSAHMRDECLALGAAEYVTKPFDPERVAEAVAARLRAEGQ